MNEFISIIDECYQIASEELKKISCYSIPACFKAPYLHHRYLNGVFYEETEGDRGEKRETAIGSTKDEFVSHLLYRKIWDFSLSYELHHRRKFEDNRRQMNEIIERCYSYLDSRYKYTLMGNLTDNIHIYFDLLDHYVGVCKKLVNKSSIPEPTMRRIRYIADREYAAHSGGMHDVAFVLDYVRYNVNEITKAVPLPALREDLMMHEGQFIRLQKLEKEQPLYPEKYLLGTWDEEVFREAEEMLTGKRLSDNEALKCALYILMLLVCHDRAVGTGIDLCFNKDIDIRKYRPVLNEIFIADKYGVYHFGPARNFDQAKKSRLTYKLLCGKTAER
ncbi:MAG: hypothetical protein IJZ47_06995 [Oscillospiraceae bacterium]|nr:hypothetical protein [Oscillospiraceae bacterium]